MSVEQTGETAPAWYRRHVAECFRRVKALIPGRRFTSSTDAYVEQYCRINGLIHKPKGNNDV